MSCLSAFRLTILRKRWVKSKINMIGFVFATTFVVFPAVIMVAIDQCCCRKHDDDDYDDWYSDDGSEC